MTIVSLLYLLLAILGLSFLVFIHELGHYYMARRLGMRVETFSIGFGKPLYTWERKGVRWQLGWLLFGGYVKIAGMDPSDRRDSQEIEGGFFQKSPLDRIKVAFMGPFVNIVFAFLAFTFLWSLGGREKAFSAHTDKIGWVDPKSELYQKGVRPGDEILSYNGEPYQGEKDHLSAPMTSGGDIDVKGRHVDFYTKEKTPFDYQVKTYPNPILLDKEILTAGILHPASYILYDRLPQQKEHPLPTLSTLPEGSPMKNSGIAYGDRLIWIDGIPLYSFEQLAHVLNDSKALLRIQRGQETFLRRVPRVLVEELRLDPEFREELIDWQFEAHLKGTKIQKLYTIPYHLNHEGGVESPVRFIDQEKEEEASPSLPFSEIDHPLQKGDRILGVDGKPVSHSYQILADLQKRHVTLIVERNPKMADVPSSKEADRLFDQEYSPKDLETLTRQIALSAPPQRSAGNLYLLNPVEPKMRKDFTFSPENQALLAEEIQEQKRQIENISDPEKRSQAHHQLEAFNRQLLLGLPGIHDRKVQYNPGPVTLFENVLEEIWLTLKALFTGHLSPKWMSGPIGIVQVVHDYSMVSWKEAIFWLGAISLNLGVLNLLPLPVLDGGTICFSLYELCTGRRLKPKTLEKLIIPFALLLIGFFVFLTYHDLLRLFRH